MNLILAAIDTSAAAAPVLETARRLGQMLDADVQAVSVRAPLESPGTTESPASLAADAAIPYRALKGPRVASLLRAFGQPDVIAVVIGARGTPTGRRPVGHTALEILKHLRKPVVIVPPDTVVNRAFRRLLVPLDGTEEASRPVLERLAPLLGSEVELVVLHVFNDGTVPAMLDRPAYDLKTLGREFLHRHCPGASEIQLRRGSVGSCVNELSEESDADLVVLSWSQDVSPGRARVVRDVLGASIRPVLVLPAEPHPTT